MNKPKSNKVYDPMIADIRDTITAGQMDYSAPLAGELELAEKYSISRGSVRKGLQELADQGLIKKVHGYGTFPVPPEKRPMSRKKEQLKLGLILPHRLQDNVQYDDYHQLLIEGVCGYAYRKGYQISIFGSETSAEKFLHEQKHGRLDGLIWLRCRTSEYDFIKKLELAGLPQVIINRTIDGITSVQVDSDSEMGQSVKYVHQFGHQAIAFINLRKQESLFIKRRDAYFKWMTYFGLVKEAEKFYIDPGFDRLDDDINKLLEHKPTAIIIGGHSLAVKTINALIQKQKCIPDDVSVIAVGDSNFARTFTPRITAVNEPRHEMGKQAVMLLEARLNGQAAAGECILMQPDLISRESCLIRTHA